MEAYSILAKYYDSLMKDFNYVDYLSFLKQNINGKNGVDLACGSGRITIELAKLNYNVIGVDISAEMLSFARDNARANGKNILFLQQDILKFDMPSKQDFVICVCDGFNYIKQSNLSALFLKIFNVLKNGGSLIFDISSHYKLSKVLGNELFYEDNEALTYFWQNRFNGSEVDMEITLFEKQKGSDFYKRFEENHKQFAHKTSDVIDSLSKAGFEVSVFDGEHFCKDYSEESQRILFVCKKI